MLQDENGDLRVLIARTTEVHKKWILYEDLIHVDIIEPVLGETMVVKAAAKGSNRILVTHTKGFHKGMRIVIGDSKNVITSCCDDVLCLQNHLKSTLHMGVTVRHPITLKTNSGDFGEVVRKKSSIGKRVRIEPPHRSPQVESTGVMGMGESRSTVANVTEDSHSHTKNKCRLCLTLSRQCRV